ncbi:hypothetical protein P171DRAFT_362731, partial [Karstenula rhodostoma CBS 690.94]
DTDAPKPSSTSDMALRSKAQVLMKAWRTSDKDDTKKAIEVRDSMAAPSVEEWSTLRLPYRVDDSPDLLSWEKPKEATDKERLNENMGMHYEAENLLFLAENLPQLRIPTLLAAWTLENSYNNPIFCHMTRYIDGVRLDGLEQFPSMSIKAQDIICAKVSAQIAYLRTFPREGWYYGRIRRQGWMQPPDSIMKNRSVHWTPTAPHNSFEEFTASIIGAYELREAQRDDESEWSPEFVGRRNKLASALKDWGPQEPKLTWLDPKFKNMVAVPIGGDAESATDWDVFLVDWEDFGWYPAWVQGLQFAGRCGAFTRTKDRYNPINAHREDEIYQMMLKDFDPGFDWERRKMLEGTRWRFY